MSMCNSNAITRKKQSCNVQTLCWLVDNVLWWILRPIRVFFPPNIYRRTSSQTITPKIFKSTLPWQPPHTFSCTRLILLQYCAVTYVVYMTSFSSHQPLYRCISCSLSSSHFSVVLLVSKLGKLINESIKDLYTQHEC